MAKKNGAKSGKEGTVHLGLLVDETGSMGGNEPAVIGGLNEFIEKVRGDETVVNVSASLAMFDKHAHDPVLRFRYRDIPLAEVTTLAASDYVPRGATPLNDAVVGMVRTLEKSVGEGDRAMLVILTDGYENASETPSRTVRKLMADKEAVGWEFVYLGANQDAWAEAEKIGLGAKRKNFNYDAGERGTRAAFRASADRARSFRDDPRRYQAEQETLADTVRSDYESEPRRRRRG